MSAAERTASREAFEQLGLLYEVTQALVPLIDRSEARQRVLEAVCSRGDWDLGLIFFEAEPGTFAIVASHIGDERLRPVADSLASFGITADEPLFQRTLAAGAASWLDLLTGESALAVQLRRAGLKAGVAGAVQGNGRVFGLDVFFTREDREHSPTVLRMLDEIGMRIGQYVERHEAENTLRAARDEADRANRAKTELLSRVSHELRTPLNAILGFSQLLLMGETSPADRQSAEYIYAAGKQLLGLIDEVLDMTRGESGRLRLDLTDLDPADILGTSLDEVREAARERLVTLSLGPIPAGLTVHADAVRLRQVLLNLLTNAVKYNRPGGVVTVGLERGPRGVAFSVADTGSGIGREALARLFTPFDRAGWEHPGVDGSGLGLALSQALARAMGGGIEVESEPGRGSRFTLFLQAGEPGKPIDIPALLEEVDRRTEGASS